MLRRLTSASAFCAALVLTASLSPGSARAAPPGESAPITSPSEDARIRVERGIEAWRKGEWTKVRDLLEPLVREGGDIEDEFLRESALRYLAEATLLDDGLEQHEREERAREYVGRLLDQTPDWSPPSGLHGRPFYDLVARVRSERDAQQAEACRGQLISCEADLTELRVDYRAAQDRILALQEDLANEDVFLTEVVKRNRGLAFLPFGVGHFTNGNFAIGGTFLALEVATGAAALGLLLYRTSNYGCVRTSGFNRNSLICTVEDVRDEDIPALQDEVERVRTAETVMGYVFVGALALDIALAQVLFKPIEVVERGQKTRRELDAELEDTEAPTGRGRPVTPAADDPPAAEPSVRLRIRPHPTVSPTSLGVGLTLEF